MSTESKRDHPAGQSGGMSRRDSIKLAAGILALGTGLGVPRQALGLAPAAARMQMKFFSGAEDGGKVLDSADLSESLTKFLASPAGARVQIKFYHPAGGEVGTLGLPAQMQVKIERLEMKRIGG
jgi:hypothetical protein